MRNTTGVGVVDKVALILNALANEPVSLAGLVELTGITRPTAHRLAVALETHRLVSRDSNGRFTIGPRVAELAGSVSEDRLVAAARPVLARLHELTNESVQLYRRRGDARACIAAVERTTGLRDSVPVGSLLSMRAGSGAQVLLAWADPDQLARGLRDAKFTAASLGAVRRRGWAQSVAEREPGVASVSAPVRNASGGVIAAISVSGPIARVTSQPGRRYAAPVMAAAGQLSTALAKRRATGRRPEMCGARVSRARAGRCRAARTPCRRAGLYCRTAALRMRRRRRRRTRRLQRPRPRARRPGTYACRSS